MSEFLIYIKLPAYERQWCLKRFGNPCVFPAQSNINAVIRHFLKQPPEGYVPKTKQSDDVAIVIPFSKSKNPRDYHYLTEPGREGIRESIDDLFRIHLYESLTDIGCRGVSQTNLIYDWMADNGIDMDQFDNVRQKFYRIMESYRKKAGINVTRGYKHENI